MERVISAVFNIEAVRKCAVCANILKGFQARQALRCEDCKQVYFCDEACWVWIYVLFLYLVFPSFLNNIENTCEIYNLLSQMAYTRR